MGQEEDKLEVSLRTAVLIFLFHRREVTPGPHIASYVLTIIRNLHPSCLLLVWYQMITMIIRGGASSKFTILQI